MSFNILIVDDSSAMRSIIKKAIKISGFDVGQIYEAGDGREALSVLDTSWVDLVLTDINMPNMNGLELIDEMKRDELMKEIPVVIISTEGSEKRIKEAKERGVKGYIKKPFLPSDIKKILNEIMGVDGYGKEAMDSGDEEFDF